MPHSLFSLCLLGLFLLVACSTGDRTTSGADTRTVDISALDIQKRSAPAKRSPVGSVKAVVPLTTASRSLASSATITAAADDKFYIRGRVQTGSGGVVPGVKLTLEENSQFGDVTPVAVGSDGSFQIEGKKGKAYVLFARAEGFAPSLTGNFKYEGFDINDIVIAMDQGRDIKGVVVNHRGKPVKNATVVAKPNNSFGSHFWFLMYEPSMPDNERTYLQLVKTDQLGQFTMSMLPADLRLDIAAEKEGYAHVAVYRMEANELPTSGLQLVLPHSGPFTGTIVDEDGKGIPEAEIMLSQFGTDLMWQKKFNTDSSGAFKLTAAPYETSGSLTVTKDGFISLTEKVAINDTPLSITLARDELVTVTVSCLDAQTLNPLTSVSLVGGDLGHKRFTKIITEIAPGRFQLRGMTNKVMHLVASAEGYLSSSWLEQPIDNQKISLLMRKTSTIIGRVIDGATGQPIKDAIFSARGQKNATTGADGQFEYIVEENANEYEVIAPDGRKSLPIKPLLPAGGTIDLGDIEIPADQQVTVRVVNASTSDPMPGERVEVELSPRLGRDLKPGLTDHKGEYHINVPAGVSLTVELPDWKLKKVTTTSKGETNQLITIPVGNGTFRGRLLSGNKPVSGNINGSHGSIAGMVIPSFKTGTSGRFEFNNLLPGQWKFEAYSMGEAYARAEATIEISPEGNAVERDFELAIAGGIITGRAVSENGNPVPNARISITTRNSNGGVDADKNGNFETWPVQVGKCDLQASHNDYGRSETITVQVPEPGEPIPPVELKLLGGSASVECTVLSIMDGTIIEQAFVSLEKNGRPFGGSTQMSNNAKIDNLPPGNYRLNCSAKGFNSVERDVNLEPNQDLKLTEVLSPACNVSVTVIDQNGYLAKGVAVSLTPLQPDSLQMPQQQTTDDQGVANFGSVLYGNYQLQATTNSVTAKVNISTSHQRELEASLIIK